MARLKVNVPVLIDGTIYEPGKVYDVGKTIAAHWLIKSMVGDGTAAFLGKETAKPDATSPHEGGDGDGDKPV